MHRALITGANGFISTALALRLIGDGVAVRAMCRSAVKGQHLAAAGAEVVTGDVQDQAGLRRHAAGCDVVFHLAAVMGSASYAYNVNVIGAVNAIEAAHLAGAARFVHISTVAVYGYDVAGRIDESHPQHPSRHDFYQQSKSIGEQAVWAYARQHGMPTVSIRPAMVYGPGSSFWSKRLYEVCGRYATPLVDGGRGHAHPIFIDDVVDLLITAAVHPDAPGNAFHAAPDPAPTWSEFLGHYARMAGNTRTLDVPVSPLKTASPLVTLLTRLAGRPFDLDGTLRFWGHRATFAMTRAADRLGWRTRISLEVGMRLTESWLKREASTA